MLLILSDNIVMFSFIVVFDFLQFLQCLACVLLPHCTWPHIMKSESVFQSAHYKVHQSELSEVRTQADIPTERHGVGGHPSMGFRKLCH